MQSISFETSGEFIQVKEAQALSGDSITFEAVIGAEVDSNQEIHVYDGPCGKGWQLIIHDIDYGFVYSSTTGKAEYTSYPITRSYGYGCEHTSRTENW